MTIIANSMQAIQVNIRDARLTAKRKDEVKLLAVSKSQPADKLREVYEAGQRAFGENYVQEAIHKQAQLNECAIEWHFIGPIQSNKTQLIAQHFSWVQSVDRLKIAARLNDARPPSLPPLNVCIQINSSGEVSKSGVAPAQLAPLARAVATLPRLRLRGLMALPAPTTDVNTQRGSFRGVREQFDALCLAGLALDTLSMGMSEDLEAAIAEGATIVRVGTAIFGLRD